MLATRSVVSRSACRTAAGLLLAVVTIGCSRRDPDTTVQASIAAIDKRLGAIEADVATCAELRASVEEIEHRLAAVEARPTVGVVVAAPTPARQESGASGGAPAESARSAPPPGFWSHLASPEGADQRTEFAALGDEYRARKAELDEQLGRDATPAERQQAVADLNRWYSTRLREMLGTEPWPAPSDQAK